MCSRVCVVACVLLGWWQLNKSDVFYGDGSSVKEEDLRHVDEITKKNQVFVAMKEGDVVLVGNSTSTRARLSRQPRPAPLL